MLCCYLNVGGVAAVLPPHEGDVLTRLLQDLSSAALVSLQCWNGVLETIETILDVISPLSLQQIVVSSLVILRHRGQVTRSIIFILETVETEKPVFNIDHLPLNQDHFPTLFLHQTWFWEYWDYFLKITQF